MTKPRDPEALLSAYLVAGMEVLPDRVVDSVLDEIHRTRQRVVSSSWRTRSMFKPSLADAAVVAVLVSGALLMSRPSQPVIGGPSPALGVSPSPSQPALTPTPTAAVTPPAVLSLDLTWTKLALDGRSPRVAWLDDRFVLVDVDSGAVSTSSDGASWHALQPGDPDPGYAQLLRGSYATWQDNVAGWWNPQDAGDGRGEITGTPQVTARDILRIVRPPAEPTETTPFKGRIGSIGIGPAGIVARVGSHLDWDAWVASRLGDDWVSHYTGVSFKDGILRIGMDNGPGLRVVWADEGFLPGDYQDSQGTGFAWYSPDGAHWTNILGGVSPSSNSGPGFPTILETVVGVSDGFIAQGDNPEDSCRLPDGCSDIWYSPDGVTWRNLGGPEACSSDCQVLPWKGGALVTDGIKRFDVWTSEGHSELPMAAELPAVSEPRDLTVGTGPLGLVTVLKDDKKILVTRGGVDSKIQPMPAEMAAAGISGRMPTVAVGERSVLIVLWSGSYEKGYVPSLWVGSAEP